MNVRRQSRWGSGSPATVSIQAGLEIVQSLKTPVDEDMDPLKRASKENNSVKLGEEEDFGHEAIVVVGATSSISCYSCSTKPVVDIYIYSIIF